MFSTKKMLLSRLGGLDVDKVFATTLYSSQSSTPNRKINTLFDPELVWHKLRQTSPHVLFDVLRGERGLDTSSTSAQNNNGAGGYGTPTSGGFFDAGFQSGPAVAWAFRRARKFFDIVTYTGNGVAGRQIPHGLGVKPGMIVVKRLDGNGNWIVQHISRGPTINLRLNTSDAEVLSSEWANTEATAQIFSVGDSGVVNGLNNSYVAYLFAHDPSSSGLIQCGQYTGNGSSIAGPVVELGWEPQWLLTKSIAARNWSILDNKRDTENPRFRRLIPNSTSPDQNSFDLDFTQTGFQPRSTSTEINGSGSTYIYLAIRKGKV